MMGDRLVSVPTTKKPCYLSQTAGLHRFLILYKDYNTAALLYGQRIFGCKDTKKKRDMERKSEKFRENHIKSEKII